VIYLNEEDDVEAEMDSDPGRLWLGAMQRGDFAAAWRISDEVLAARGARGHAWDAPRHEQWLWDGRPLAGRRVLVHCYHGLGDTIQFARFLPALSQLAREIVVAAQPPLVPLLGTLDCLAGVIALDDSFPNAGQDADVEIMELGHILRITPEQLPGRVPYFTLPPEPRRATRCGVGVVLTSGEWDTRRSVPEARLGDLNSDVDWFNLQLGTPLRGMVDVSTPNILSLARRVMALDLVISVDTMVAHLAGALGVRTWVLLPFEADWRWQTARSDSPWYPTMRLFRQPRPDDWESVMASVRAELPCAR
jgi:hypothetical protein